MVTKNLALVIVFIVFFVKYVLAVIKKMRGYDNRIISKNSKRIQCTFFALFSLCITVIYLFKDNGQMLWNILSTIKSYSAEPHVFLLWGWYFIYSFIGGILYNFLIKFIFSLREIKDMEALKTYYFAYDTLQKDRELFKGRENEKLMNEYIDNALIELDKLTTNKRDHVRMTSMRYILFQILIQKMPELSLEIKRIEEDQQRNLRRYAQEISKLEIPDMQKQAIG